MGRIPEHAIDEVRSRADIVDVVARYVTLKKQGPRHWGLCPFHSEKTPSFQVHEDKQIYYCFGCGAGGDVFGFRMRHDGLDFPDAVRAIARDVGVAIAEQSSSGERTTPLFEMHDRAAGYYRDVLRGSEGRAARDYLGRRGVPTELWDRFQLGAAPAKWDGLIGHLGGRGPAIELAEKAGLVSRRQGGDGHYDRFRDRLLFPIQEPDGRIVAFGGRVLGQDEPKYLNSPESPIYRKSRALFGLPQALDAIRRSGRVVVVEGYFDVIALHRCGVQEAIAPCGTALTQEHARRLRRYTEDLVLLFDGDEAGRRAAERALPALLAGGMRVRAAFLPEGDDPDTLISRAGPEALARAVDDAPPLLDQLIERELKGAQSHAWAASDAAKALAPYLRAVSDPIEREGYLRRIAVRLDVSPHTLSEALERGARAERTPPPEESPAPERIDLGAVDAPSRDLLEMLIAHPDLVPLVEPADVARLPEGPGRSLLETLVPALRAHGAHGLARLCSAEGEGAAPPALAAALAELASRGELVERENAEQAVRDCTRHLRKRALDLEYHALVRRIDDCPSAEERNALLEALQRKLEEIGELASGRERLH